MIQLKLTALFYIAGMTIGLSQPAPNKSFQSGESLKFKGSYYMSSLWADLAEVKIDVTDYVANGKPLFSILATASTYSNYDTSGH